MMLAETFGCEWMRISLPFPCEIHWCQPRRMEENGNYKVLMIYTEPVESLISVDDLKSVYHFFDLIIAADPRYGIFPNCIIRPFGSLWATKMPPAKDFSVSFLFSLGALRETRPGYQERIKVVQEMQRATVPLRVFKGRMFATQTQIELPLLPEDSKNSLFNSMFHIAVENSFDTNYFTEKLVDCLMTYTVPIYMGCPNIADYFDTDGMILVPPGGSIIDTVNRLTINDYWSRAAIIAENAKRSRKYADFQVALRKAIMDASGY